MCISVDLPEPEGPVAATNSPGSMSSDTPRSACTFTSPTSYVLMRSRTEITGITDLPAAPPAAAPGAWESAAREALTSAAQSRERSARRRRRLARGSRDYVCHDFGAFLQLTIHRLNQLGLLTVGDAEA